MRWGVFALSTVVALVVVAAGIVATEVRNVEGPARVEISPGVVAVATGPSYAYVLKGATGVVLVDSGGDHAAKAVIEELERSGHTVNDVRAVLITSAHPFTLAGLDALPSVPIYVGGGDEELARRARFSHAPLARVIGRLSAHGKRDNPIIPVLAGARLVLDGIAIDAIATPGVSGGARSYVIGDVAFVGPSLVSRAEHLELPSFWLADNRDHIVASMQRLDSHTFTWLAGATFEPQANGRMAYDAWKATIPDARRQGTP